ncbi:NAD-glutamate dehydrogenase [Sphingomonas crusticola]|uniref:NAD-glutamate dehydrogenase n=1 Tax=Sphingomonas crusticola TaxID=1697973 RepID=UPI0013C352C4|nr:NAD-glutamate dehydrogenase [Sphingomonas crusticola]
MGARNSNDNSPPGKEPPHRPDPHGQAAILLVESLIHGLVARSVLTVADAVEIVATAAAVKEDVGADMGDTPATLARSLAILEAIEASLALDLHTADASGPAGPPMPIWPDSP